MMLISSFQVIVLAYLIAVFDVFDIGLVEQGFQEFRFLFLPYYMTISAEDRHIAYIH